MFFLTFSTGPALQDSAMPLVVALRRSSLSAGGRRVVGDGQTGAVVGRRARETLCSAAPASTDTEIDDTARVIGPSVDVKVALFDPFGETMWWHERPRIFAR